MHACMRVCFHLVKVWCYGIWVFLFFLLSVVLFCLLGLEGFCCFFVFLLVFLRKNLKLRVKGKEEIWKDLLEGTLQALHLHAKSHDRQTKINNNNKLIN